MTVSYWLSHNIYYAAEVAAFLTCAVSYRRLDARFKWLLPYLAFVVVYELVNIFGLLIWHKTNSWCNNMEGILEFVLFTRFMLLLDGRERYKKPTLIAAAVVLLFSLADMAFIQGFFKLNTLAVVVQSIFLLVLIFRYYAHLLGQDHEALVLYKHPPFVAATGMLFYFLGNTFYYACFSYLAYKHNYDFLIVARTVPVLAELLLDGMLIWAFVCCWRAFREVKG